MAVSANAKLAIALMVLAVLCVASAVGFIYVRDLDMRSDASMSEIHRLSEIMSEPNFLSSFPGQMFEKDLSDCFTHGGPSHGDYLRLVKYKELWASHREKTQAIEQLRQHMQKVESNGVEK